MSDHPDDIEAFPFFQGARRVPTLGGVPTKVLWGAVMAVASIAMLSTILWLWLLIVPIYIALRVMTQFDDRFFRKVSLWVQTKFINRNKKFWRASTYGTGLKRRGVK